MPTSVQALRPRAVFVSSILLPLTRRRGASPANHTMTKHSILISFLVISSYGALFAQKMFSADKIVSVVGDKVILESDVQKQLLQEQQDNAALKSNPNAHCLLLSGLMTKKLLLIQAAIDSVTVEDADVDNEMNQRFNVMMRTNFNGDQEKMEAFLGKSLLEYKEEIRPEVAENKLAQKMQAKLVEKVTVSPAEVTQFYKALPKDSIPLIGTEVLVGQIIRNPKFNEQEKQAARDKVSDLRDQIKKGKKFETMALLYSMDPGSSSHEGDLGFISRGSMVKEFEAIAFRLKPGELSQPVETEFGYHLIQVVERRGNQIHVRHILITPTLTQSDLDSARIKLDTVYRQLKAKKLNFAQAAVLYSDDESTKGNAGIISQNAVALTQLEQDDHTKPTMFAVIDTMKAGDITPPLEFTFTQQGKKGFRLVYLKSKTDPHKADLTLDYSRIQNFALQAKQKRMLDEWVVRKRRSTYIKIDAGYLKCSEMQDWAKSATRF